MHELAVCQALIGEVDAVARANRAAAVTDIYVSIGPLSGVEAALLYRAFPLAAAGTVASGADLHIEETPVRVRCGECGVETTTVANRLVCGSCGDWRPAVISGDEMLLQRVAMQTLREVHHV